MLEGEAPPRWVSTQELRELGDSLHDPPDLTRLRQHAFESYQELALEPNPLYRKYGYFAGVNLAEIEPAATGPRVRIEDGPSDVVQIVHDAAGTHITIPRELEKAGVVVQSLPELWKPSEEAARSTFLRGLDAPADRLSALGIALLNRGYRLSVPGHLPDPVRLRDLVLLSQRNEAISVRRSIAVGAGTRFLATEETYSATPSAEQRLVSSSTDLAVGPEAHAAFLTVHAPDSNAISLYHRSATADRASKLGWIWAGFGGFRTKCRNTSTLAGAGSDLEDLQTFFGAGNQAYDSSIQIEHVGTDTHGRSMTRGVFRDDARGMSRGLVRIEKQARKTVSFLSEHAMLLSRGARSDTIPILEILCRDVKATHSTSVAPVDPEKVFYLESRGLDRTEAVRTISEGFLSNILDRAPIGRLSDGLYPHLEARWAGAEVAWANGRSPALPRLDFAADVPPTDWRFDAKLR